MLYCLTGFVCSRDKDHELSACVENANIASRLVHWHFDRENSGTMLTEDNDDVGGAAMNGVTFSVSDHSLSDDDIETTCLQIGGIKCDEGKPDSSSSGVEDGSIPEGNDFDRKKECHCYEAAKCICGRDLGSFKWNVKIQKHSRSKESQWMDNGKSVFSDLEDDWSGVE